VKRLLYLGLRPRPIAGYQLVHYPVIRIEPVASPELEAAWPQVTHLVISSPTVAELLHLSIEGRRVIALGAATAARCVQRQIQVAMVASEPTAEGVVDLLKTIQWPPNALCAIPCSSRSRNIIAAALEAIGIAALAPILYHTHLQQPGPPPLLEQFDAIAFTSPSTVHGFVEIYGAIPQGVELLIQGPVTLDTINSLR
jgi:uroporphyrinogen-III synthase